MPRRSIPLVALCAAPLAARIALAQAPGQAPAPTSADSAAIRAAALDYIDGWYSADAVRMRRALHPELAKRNVTTDPTTGRSRLTQMSAMTLVQQTERGGGSAIAADRRTRDVRVLDIYGGAATVRVTAATWIDYMHLAKYNGTWVIVNVLWEDDPGPGGRPR